MKLVGRVLASLIGYSLPLRQHLDPHPAIAIRVLVINRASRAAGGANAVAENVERAEGGLCRQNGQPGQPNEQYQLKQAFHSGTKLFTVPACRMPAKGQDRIENTGGRRLHLNPAAGARLGIAALRPPPGSHESARPVTKSAAGRSAGVLAGLNYPHTRPAGRILGDSRTLSRRGRRRSGTLSLALHEHGRRQETCLLEGAVHAYLRR